MESISPASDKAEAPQFEYRPLAEGEFRLIWFIEAGDDSRCELKHFDLDDAPPYWALSYTWGTEQATSELSLDGRTLAIRPNLRAALERIGSRIKDERRYLWVDAICINQQDIPERNAQVLQMKSIYADASLVAIWLGEHSDNSKLAIDSIIRFGNQMRLLQSREGCSHRHLDLAQALGLESNTPAYEKVLDAVAKLSTRPWWGRLWVVQESTASNDKLFLVGKDSLTWQDFEAWQWVSDPTVLYRNSCGRFQSLQQLAGERNLGSTSNMLNLCCKFRKRRCTDPRDKINALAGIASGLGGAKFSAKYSSSVQDAYIDFVQFQIRASQGYSQIDFLGCVFRKPLAQFKKVYDTLPTWVPDWRSRLMFIPFRKPPFPLDYEYQREGVQLKQNERLYSASRDTLFQGRIANRLEFHVRGFLVDRVLQLSPAQERGYLALEDRGPVGTWAISSGNEAYDASETKQQAFLRTITADIWYGWRHGWRKLKRPHSYHLRCEETTQENEQDADPGSVVSHASMMAATFGRRFMWAKGGRMGLAPAAANVNDKICVFFGGQVLYLLREVAGGKHEFMGECYVHGLMDGEALDPDERYKERIEDFVLV